MNYFDDSFQRFRAEALEFEHNRMETLLKSFLNEIGFDEPIAYSKNYNDMTIEIYTNKPAYLIGCEGKNFDLLQKSVQKEYGNDWRIRFVEIHGYFVTP